MIFLHLLGEVIVLNDTEHKELEMESKCSEETKQPEVSVSTIVEFLSKRYQVSTRQVHVWNQVENDVENEHEVENEELRDLHFYCFIDSHVPIDLAWITSTCIRAEQFVVFDNEPSSWIVSYRGAHTFGTSEWCRFMTATPNLFDASSARLHVKYTQTDFDTFQYPLIEIGLFRRSDLLSITAECHRLSLHSLEPSVLQEKQQSFVSGQFEVDLSWFVNNNVIRFKVGQKVHEKLVKSEELDQFVLYVGVRVFRQVGSSVEIKCT